MCSLTDHVVEGILKYSLIPYAEQNNIEIKELIKKLSEYHKTIDNKNNMGKNKEQDNTLTPKTKRPRGRPKGSSKKQLKELQFNTD